jgi:predicted nucleic acid-binding Zn ribbon protein
MTFRRDFPRRNEVPLHRCVHCGKKLRSGQTTWCSERCRAELRLSRLRVPPTKEGPRA